jgi:hypothetical protein
MPKDEHQALHPACLDRDTLLAQCDVRRQRRSGPGGQHRNKVETGVFLHHRPSGQSGEATERRSQALNLQGALFRLRVKLAIHVRSPRTVAVPGVEWLRRVRGGRLPINPSHDDFPCLLANALDALEQQQWQVPATAVRLHCTTSQLIKLLKHEPLALNHVNGQREAQGLRPVR